MVTRWEVYRSALAGTKKVYKNRVARNENVYIKLSCRKKTVYKNRAAKEERSE